MSIRVYEYGLLPPTVNAELVLSQMRDAHRYRNMLTEIERERRTKVREIMAAHQDMAPLQARVNELTEARDAARAEISKARAITRSRSDSKAQRTAVQDLNAQIREVVAAIKAIRKDVAADPTVQLGLKLADEHSRQRVRNERAKCGVYWGTYLLQEADADRARQETSMPKFEPFRGDGRVSVQLQGGLELPGLWGTDTQIRIDPVNPDAWDLTQPRGVRRRGGRTVARLRVASERGKPVWAQWPMIMHRPLPEGAVVKVATVVRRKRDCVSWYWRLQLTVDVTACTSGRRPAPASGAVALNLGFCVRPGGALRAGYLLGTDGERMEVLAVKSDIYRDKELTQEQYDRALTWISNGLRKADDIRSIRDNNLNLMKAAFAPWCAALAEPGRTRDDKFEQPGQSGLIEQEQPGEPGTARREREQPGPRDVLEELPGRRAVEQDLPEASGREVPMSGHAVAVRGGPGAPGLTQEEQDEPGRSGRHDVHDVSTTGRMTRRQDDPGHAPGPTRGELDWLGRPVRDTNAKLTQERPTDVTPAVLSGWVSREQEEPTRVGLSRLDQDEPDKSGHGQGDHHDESGRTPGPVTPSADAWFMELTTHVGLWLSAARFRALSLRWETERFTGDEGGFAMLLAWRERDEHLERYESGIRGSAIRDRLETYRIIASKMAQRYHTLVIDGTDLSKYQAAGNTEDEAKDNETVRRNQRIAGPSLLRGALMNAFGPERTVKMPPGKRTTTCHSCGVVNEWDRTSSDRIHACTACGIQWDIDANFCRNLLADWATGDSGAEEAAPRKPSRSQRLRTAASAKTAKSAGAT